MVWRRTVARSAAPKTTRTVLTARTRTSRSGGSGRSLKTDRLLKARTTPNAATASTPRINPRTTCRQIDAENGAARHNTHRSSQKNCPAAKLKRTDHCADEYGGEDHHATPAELGRQFRRGGEDQQISEVRGGPRSQGVLILRCRNNPGQVVQVNDAGRPAQKGHGVDDPVESLVHLGLFAELIRQIYGRTPHGHQKPRA